MADSNGLTPLHSAAACGFLQMASILIIFGADIFAKANDGDLPVDYSKDTDMSDLLQTQMINVIQVREYVNSYILYQGREWIIWILRMCLLFIGQLVDIVISLFHHYLTKYQIQRRPDIDNIHYKDN